MQIRKYTKCFVSISESLNVFNPGGNKCSVIYNKGKKSRELIQYTKTIHPSCPEKENLVL
jgi:hypothetical protein